MIADAKKAVKKLIKDSKASLVANLTRQGQDRTIAHITTSRGTPPRTYFYIAIHARPVRREVKMKVANDAIDFLKTVYVMSITVVDYLIPERGEEELYETSTESSDILVDRLLALFETGDYQYGNSRFILRDPLSIEADPAIVTWEEAEAYHHVYVCEISFELEKC